MEFKQIKHRKNYKYKYKIKKYNIIIEQSNFNKKQ